MRVMGVKQTEWGRGHGAERSEAKKETHWEKKREWEYDMENEDDTENEDGGEKKRLPTGKEDKRKRESVWERGAEKKIGKRERKRE